MVLTSTNYLAVGYPLIQYVLYIATHHQSTIDLWCSPSLSCILSLFRLFVCLFAAVCTHLSLFPFGMSVGLPATCGVALMLGSTDVFDLAQVGLSTGLHYSMLIG